MALPADTPAVAVDGLDLVTLGFRVAGWSGDGPLAAQRPGTVAAPGPQGERLTGAVPTLAPRTITVRGTVLAATAVADRATARDTAVAALLEHCAGGPATADGTTAAVALTLGSRPDIRWTAYLAADTTVEALGAQALDGEATVTLTFVCPDPRATDTEPTDVALSTTAAAVPVGTAPGGAVIVLAGAWTSGVARTLTYQNASGTTRGTLTITPTASLASGEWVEIDLDAETVTQVTASGATRTPRAAWRTGGTWFRLAPADASGATSPTLTVSAGTGTATIARRWR